MVRNLPLRIRDPGIPPSIHRVNKLKLELAIDDAYSAWRRSYLLLNELRLKAVSDYLSTTSSQIPVDPMV